MSTAPPAPHGPLKSLRKNFLWPRRAARSRRYTFAFLTKAFFHIIERKDALAKGWHLWKSPNTFMYTPAHRQHICFTPHGPQNLFIRCVVWNQHRFGLFHFWCVPKNISKESNLRKANPGTTDVSSHNFWLFLKYDNSGKKFVKTTLFPAKVVDWTSMWWILWDADLNGVWTTEPSTP